MRETHDVIIIGAGTAGSILAERLSSSGQLRVLLIEAGGPPMSRFVSRPLAPVPRPESRHCSGDSDRPSVPLCLPVAA